MNHLGASAAFGAILTLPGGLLAHFTWRRTGTALPGALICGLLVICYIVAGTATQALI